MKLILLYRHIQFTCFLVILMSHYGHTNSKECKCFMYKKEANEKKMYKKRKM